MSRFALPLALAATLLTGCDMLGIESPEQVAAAREAEGKAIGAACRQAGRAIEDCYTLNRRVGKAAIFAGWLEMNDYMRENKLETVTPVIVASQESKSTNESKPWSKGTGTKYADPKAVDQDTEVKGAGPGLPEADNPTAKSRLRDARPS